MPPQLNGSRTRRCRTRGCCKNANLSYFDDNGLRASKVLTFDAAASSSKLVRENVLIKPLGDLKGVGS